MIIVDTGPLVGLFDPRDAKHAASRATLRRIDEPLRTTVPVLTEAFHMLNPGSLGAANLRLFVDHGGAAPWFMDVAALSRAFELMKQYEDHPMDLADASLVAAGERMGVRTIWTFDVSDFKTYRLRKGHRLQSWQILQPVEPEGTD